jgi:excinuclease ABC subunit A
LRLEGVTRNNLQGLNVEFPIACFSAVTGVSGSGKSSLVSQALPELVSEQLGRPLAMQEEEELDPLLEVAPAAAEGRIIRGMEQIRRLVQVDQKPIGRTPRSNLATYSGLFDPVRQLFAGTAMARKHRYNAGRFSFNVAGGRCPTCEGEGFVMVELLFLPSVYAPCSTCHGSRYNSETLAIEWQGRNIAQVLEMTVDEACQFFSNEPKVLRPLTVLREIGLGYLRLGQPATELSGGEAQRIKLATELQRAQHGNTLYILDEPTAGLHPADVDRLMHHLQGLVDVGNTVVVVEHDMRFVAQVDWVIDLGPGAGEDGGCIVASGTPDEVATVADSRTAAYLKPHILRG